MVEHIVLLELQPHVGAERLEWLIRTSRIHLLRIPEVHVVRSGKRIWPECPWPFFFSLECENMDKLARVLDDPNYIKFRETILKPNTMGQVVLDFELEPGRDVKFS
jgi:hypothetical protein